MRQKFALVASLLVGALITGCAAPMGANIAAKRNYVRNMRDSALARLYFYDPNLRAQVAEAAGVAVFDSLNIHLLLLGTSKGYGIAVDNATGKETYMKVFRLGAGIGAGLKDFRAIFIFKDPATLETFIEKGWQFGPEGEAAMIAGGRTGVALGLGAGAQPSGVEGGARFQTGMGTAEGGGLASQGMGMRVYEITENGIVLQATIAGTIYVKDAELN